VGKTKALWEERRTEGFRVARPKLLKWGLRPKKGCSHVLP